MFLIYLFASVNSIVLGMSMCAKSPTVGAVIIGCGVLGAVCSVLTGMVSRDEK